jgi:hypothetical protein
LNLECFGGVLGMGHSQRNNDQGNGKRSSAERAEIGKTVLFLCHLGIGISFFRGTVLWKKLLSAEC